MNSKKRVRDNKHAFTPYITYIFSLLLIILIIYRRDIIILINEGLSNESISHVLIIPFLTGILFYVKKDMFKGSLLIEDFSAIKNKDYIDKIIGACFCLISLLIYWYGSYTFHPLEYHLLTLPIFLIGIILILFNLKTMFTLLSSVIFLFLLTPPPTKLIYNIGGIMANFNTYVSHLILKNAGLPVNVTYAYGAPSLTLISSVGSTTFFTIDVPCSGIYSLMGFIIFSVFLFLISSASIIKKISVNLLGFLVFFSLNIIRVVIIVSVAHFINEELAMTLFHLLTGFILIFGGIIFTLFIAEKIFKMEILPWREDTIGCADCEKYYESSKHFCISCGTFLNNSPLKIQKSFFIKVIVLIICCTIAIITVNAPVFTFASGPIDLTTNVLWANTTNILPEISGYQPYYLHRDLKYEKISNQDASLVYAYFPSTINTTSPIIYVAVGVAESMSNLHSWEVCLISIPEARGETPQVTTLSQKDIMLLPEVPLIARYLVFSNKNNDTQNTLYWHEKATFKTGITLSQRYVRISLIILTEDPKSYSQYEEILLDIGEKVASYWEPIKTRSLISLGVPAQQLLLITSVLFAAFTKITEYILYNQKRNKNKTIFLNYASDEEKLILQSIQEITEHKKNVETREIINAMENINKKINPEELIKILNQFESYGFIQRDIVFHDNKIKLTWKINIL